MNKGTPSGGVATRIVKNTSFLYGKMCVNFFLSLYSMRLVLQALGAADLGVYNVVGGAIAMLGFLNSTMSDATQRFMSYAEGQGDKQREKQVFNVSVVLQLIIAVATVLFLIVLMPVLFNGVLNIDADRVNAAKVVYLCLIFSTLLTIINVPYEAMMTAHENMLYYSIIGIFENILKLVVALVILRCNGDRLVLYGVLMACIPLITLSIMKIYCHRHYEECVISVKKYWDGSIIKEIASYSGWNFLTAIGILFTTQGVGIVLNHFFGSVLNAAQGIAMQVGAYLTALSYNMKKSVNPILVKSVSTGDFAMLHRVSESCSKYSSLLIMIFAVPFIIEMPYILDLWLKDVPQWTVLFCRLQLVQVLIIESLAVYSKAIHAQGDIKKYSIYKSIINISPVITTYIAYRLGGGVLWLYASMLIVFAIGGNIVILIYSAKLLHNSDNGADKGGDDKARFSLVRYCRKVFAPLLLTCLLMFAVGIVPMLVMESSFLRLVITALACTLVMFVCMSTFAATSSERRTLISMVCKMLHIKCKALENKEDSE